ncbi:MAG: hypothetical protein J5881_00915 [Clostridia bacterium]|nr:hypothetical protein [Clostridia bacterium]
MNGNRKGHCAKSRLCAMMNPRGITLTTLVVTIVVLLILASIATYSGIEAIDNSKRTKFIAELKIMQSHVNQWYEDCKPNNVQTWSGNIEEKYSGSGAIWLGSTNTDDSAIIEKAKNTLTVAGITINANNFYYLSSSTLERLGVEGVSQDVLVSIQDRKVVSYLGLKYKNAMYYTIDSLDGENGIDAIYNVDYTNPNSGQPSFSVKAECLEPGISKITVYDIQYTTGYNTKWKVYYKKDYDTDWQTSDDLSFRVTQDGVYTIKLTNQNGDIVGTATAEIGAFAYKKKNSTLASSTNKATMNSKNPVIPQGFKAVDTDTAKWKYTDSTYSVVQGWNDGLVIEDDIGNQFVWVPCSLNEITENGQPKIVAYSKNFSYPSIYSASDLNTSNAFDTTTIDGVKYSAIPVRENEQVNTYGGFYVARFEAGLPTETLNQSDTLNNVYTEIPVSKYGSKLWNYIDYEHSYVAAEKMINNTSKYGKNKSGLITGTQWDTIMQWYAENDIPILANNQNWGTYTNLPYSINGLYFTNNTSNLWKNENVSHGSDDSLHIFHASGLNNNGYKKNIADLGGNVWEWTSEKFSIYRIFRACSANGSSTDYPVTYRNRQDSLSQSVGFRVVLYIQDEPQKEYVTDGLLAYYDAENNTGTGHSFATTTWKDLSGNNNDATLSGFDGTDASGWHSNYLAFDGQNDYVTGAFNSNGDITVEFIAKNKNTTNATMFMLNKWDTTQTSYQLWGGSHVRTPRLLVPRTSTETYVELSGGQLGYSGTNNITSYIISKNQNSINTYNNGKVLGQYNNLSFIQRFNFNNTNFTIGRWHTSNAYYSNQNVYAMRIYNRALTEDEIRQNYEIDKVRFNIQE